MMQKVVFGVHSVESLLLEAESSVISVLVLSSKTSHKKIQSIISLCENKNILVKLVDETTIDKLVGVGNHQGIVATIKQKEHNNIDNLDELLFSLNNKTNSTVLVLDGITDVHNLGAIIRTAECFGVDGIILPKNNSANPNNGMVNKISSGAINYIPIIMVANINRTLELLKQHEYWIIGSTLSDKSSSLFEYKPDNKIVVVMGSEDKGMRRLVTENCDYLLAIPMYGKTQSLNVSVATGVILSYVKYQQTTSGVQSSGKLNGN